MRGIVIVVASACFVPQLLLGGPLLERYFPFCDGDSREFSSTVGAASIRVTATTYNGQAAFEMRVTSGSGSTEVNQRRFFAVSGDDLLYLGMNIESAQGSLQATFSPPLRPLTESVLASGGVCSGTSSTVLIGTGLPPGGYAVNVIYNYTVSPTGRLNLPGCDYENSRSMDGSFTFLDPLDPEDPELTEIPEFMYLAPSIGPARIRVFALNQFGILIPRGWADLSSGRICGNAICSGSLQVEIQPAELASAGGQWRRVGTDLWRNHGETESGVPQGNYQIEFTPVDGWTSPSTVTVSIVEGSIATATGVYSRHTGSLRVAIEPPDAADAGGQWRRTGTDTWRAANETEGAVPTGNHTLEFRPVPDWITPEPIAIVIEKDAAASATGVYMQAAWIVKAPEPQTAARGGDVQFTVSAQGTAPLRYQWTRDGVLLSDGDGVLGSDTATLKLHDVTVDDDGASFSVTVSNDLGTVTSDPATLTVVETVSISGVVRAETVGGDPLESVTIQLTGPDTDETQTTGPDGAFRFIDLTIGAYRIQFERAGYYFDQATIERSINADTMVEDVIGNQVPALEFARIGSGQIPGLDRNFLPPDPVVAGSGAGQTGNRENYILMGALADGTARIHTEIGVTPDSSPLSDRVRVRLAAKDGGDSWRWATPPISVSNGAAVLSVEPESLTEPIGEYALVAWVDVDGDDLVNQPAEVDTGIQSESLLRIVTASAYAESIRALDPTQRHADGLFERLEGRFDRRIEPETLPVATDLLNAFLEGKRPFHATDEGQTAVAFDSELAHHVGVSDADGTIPLFRFDGESMVARQIRASWRMSQLVTRILSNHHDEIVSSPGVVTLPTGISTISFRPEEQFQSTLRNWESETDLWLAFNQADIDAELLVEWDGESIPRIGLRGVLRDLYHFDLSGDTDDDTSGRAEILRRGAMVQAGFPTLGADGQVFRVEVTLDGEMPNISAGWAPDIWMDDEPPPGAVTRGTGGDSWNWVTEAPPPYWGTRSLQSNLVPGETHQILFERVKTPFTVHPYDTLFAYVNLDPASPPETVMLQWHDGQGWGHRAYWGADSLQFGKPDSPERFRAGPLPSTDHWQRLEVDARSVGLAGKEVHGMAFTLRGGKAGWDLAAHSAAQPTQPLVWVDDDVPTGAILLASGGDEWTWTDTEVFSGTRAHVSALVPDAPHQQLIRNMKPLEIRSGDRLFAHVRLDPDHPPRQVMLQWLDDKGWEHRAFWGENLLPYGEPDTPSRLHVAALPPPGQWVRLSVPAEDVDLVDRAIRGMAFTLHGGRATWDFSGVDATIADPVRVEASLVATDSGPELKLTFEGRTGWPYAVNISDDLRLWRHLDDVEMPPAGSSTHEWSYPIAGTQKAFFRVRRR